MCNGVRQPFDTENIQVCQQPSSAQSAHLSDRGCFALQGIISARYFAGVFAGRETWVCEFTGILLHHKVYLQPRGLLGPSEKELDQGLLGV